MSRNYNDLLKVAYEIEGLLTLQSQRNDGAIAAVDRLIAEKIAILAEAFPTEAEPEVKNATENAAENEVKNEGKNEVIPAELEAPAAEAPAAEAPAAEAPAAEAPAAEAPTAPAFPETTVVNETIETTVVNETIETPLSLEEKLARERARDIFRAFTLNDKFRFRRELFRNSQEEFDEVLNVISQMSTIEEAEEYIYDDLCWTPDNEDVKAFMEVVTKHF